MQLFRHTPPAPLDQFIECFWWSHRDEPQRHCEHMLPSGGAQLIFALHETPITLEPPGSSKPTSWSGGIIHGPQSGHYKVGPKPEGAVLGVSFRPGCAGAILGTSMADLVDRHVTLQELWGRRGIDLHQRLLSTREPQGLFEILARELSARIERPLLMHPAVAHLLAPRSFGIIPSRVGDVQRDSGYSPRYFIALFRSSVGLTPKHFYRIRRFNSAVRRLASPNPISLADVAAATGYSDQAHLTREFREFAGVAPTQYRPAALDRPLHHHAEEPSPGKKSSRRRS
jgi:AraC-like DNA-binding protein